MLWALADYKHYKRKSGRFEHDCSKSIMGGAFEGELPETAVRILQPGDVLFVQTLGWPLSWSIMYLTSSEVSHVAFYIGNREISHATLSGVSTERIEALFDPNTRLLPCVWPMPDEKRLEVVQFLKEHCVGVPYGWLPVFVKAFRILAGRDWPYFRWKFFGDIALALIFLDLPLMFLTGHPIISWVIPAYLAVIGFNSVLWRFKPLKLSEWTGKPIDILRMLQSQGGTFVFDAYSIEQQRISRLGTKANNEIAPP